MFGFLRRLFGGKPATPGRVAIFRVALPDGAVRTYDPMTVRATLNQILPDWAEKSDELSKTRRPLPAGASKELASRRVERAAGLIDELSGAAAKAFHLPLLADDGTGSGYSRPEVLMVYGEWLAYCLVALELTRPLAIGVEPTDSPASADPSPTKSGSDSPCTPASPPTPTCPA